ncbi:hypothetical protein LA080_011331 [Diaporthe eres]|uniref:BTB domain-containing protein n=1 Tax=Diaporthe vaccinii TaxID=105482 RepID=A0ABR4E5A5_9PEZI|nr:hypothetical protein LA080_011331 [Diaporthe eres]
MSTSNNDNQDPDPPGVQNRVANSVSFSHCDKVVLQTGYYSDAQVTQGTRVWDVHTSIVCMRSGVMCDALEQKSTAGEKMVAEFPRVTEKQMELALEFIYTGNIETIDDFTLADCVDLLALDYHFCIPEMEMYAQKTLWDKLTCILRAVSAILPISDARSRQDAIDAKLNELNFHKHFTDAVDKAYYDFDNGCRRVLADFVWAGRAWLIRHPIIEELNVKHHKFGSHVLTTLTKGPQSSFIQADGQLTSAADTLPGTLCANCARAQAERPSQALELVEPVWL